MIGPPIPSWAVPSSHQRGNRAQRLDMEPQGDGREGELEFAQDGRHPARRDQHVDRQRDLGLQPFEQTADLGAKAVDIVGDRPRFGQHRLAGLGQLWLFRPLPLEQGHAQLCLEIDDAVADHRNRAVELPRGAVEAALVDDGEEDLSWSSVGEPGLAIQLFRIVCRILSQFSGTPSKPISRSTRRREAMASEASTDKSEWQQVSRIAAGIDWTRYFGSGRRERTWRRSAGLNDRSAAALQHLLRAVAM